MRSLGLHVVRGKARTQTTNTRITLFERGAKVGYKIIDFTISLRDLTATSPSHISAKISTVDMNQFTGRNADQHWEDSRELAWCTAFYDANATGVGPTIAPITVIDPSNLVVEDVYVGGYNYSSGQDFNYMIVFEKFALDDGDTALTMVRNRYE